MSVFCFLGNEESLNVFELVSEINGSGKSTKIKNKLYLTFHLAKHTLCRVLYRVLCIDLLASSSENLEL